MSEIGSGTGTSYPTSIDTDTTQEVNSPNVGKTKARAEVVNDLGAAVVAIESTLGTNPHGAKSDVKTFLQTEHGTDGKHSAVTCTYLMNTSAVKLLNFTSSATPVNYAQITNADTANGPVLSSQGTDTNIDLNLTPKGTGQLKVNGKFLGTWDTSQTINAIHGPAASDIWVKCYTPGNAATNAYINALTSATPGASTDPPALSIDLAKNQDAVYGTSLSVSMLVKRGDYWKIVTSGTMDTPVVNVIAFGA